MVPVLHVFTYSERHRNPEVISRVRNSSEVLARAWNEARKVNTASADFLRKVIITEGLGITDATKEEIDRILDWSPEKKDITDLENILAEMVSRRALIGVSYHDYCSKRDRDSRIRPSIVDDARPYCC